MIDYDRKLSRVVPFPGGAAIQFFGADPPTVVLSVKQGPGETNIRIEGEQLLAALILFCHRRRVPLPARGSKVLSMVNGRLAILVKLPMDATATGGRSRAPPDNRQRQPRLAC